MPSGSKKRKAAKRKKEQEAKQNIINNDSHPHGNDDPGSQVEKKSDGEASTLVSHNQDAPQLSEFGNGDPPTIRSSVTEKEFVTKVTRDTESTKKVGLDSEGAIVVESELKSHKNNAEKFNDLGSDKANAIANFALKEAGVISVQETVPVVDSINHAVSESKKVMRVEIKPDKTSMLSDVVRLTSNGNQEKPLADLDKETEDKILPFVAETSISVGNIKESEIPECAEENKTHAASAPSAVRRTSCYDKKAEKWHEKVSANSGSSKKAQKGFEF